jgi:hypothetical protein
MTFPRLPWTILLLLVSTSACGIDDNYTGLGNGALPGDPLKPLPVSASVDVVIPPCPECNCAPADVMPDIEVAALAGRGWRFDSLVLTAPLTGATADMLNGYFADAIASGEMNVLLFAASQDQAAGKLLLKVGAGKKDGDDFAFDGTPSDFACSLAGDALVTDEPSSLSFPNGYLDPPALPLKQLSLSATVAADGSALSDGKLDGALLMADAKKVVVLGMDLAAFLSTDFPADLDTDGDGKKDAWHFLGTFTAAEVAVKEVGR